MEKVIKDRRLGPYTTLRVAYYHVLSQVLQSLLTENQCAEGTPRGAVPLNTLLGLAKEKAKAFIRNHFESQQLTFKDGEQPWKEVVRLLAQIMTRAEAAVGKDGLPVPPGAKGMTVQVTGLAPDWDRRVDAEILFAFLSAEKGLRLEDFDDIGGVLYHQFYPEHEVRERVADLVARLMDAERVEERSEENGIGFVYVARTITPVNRMIKSVSHTALSANGTGHTDVGVQ